MRRLRTRPSSVALEVSGSASPRPSAARRSRARYRRAATPPPPRRARSTGAGSPFLAALAVGVAEHAHRDAGALGGECRRERIERASDSGCISALPLAKLSATGICTWKPGLGDLTELTPVSPAVALPSCSCSTLQDGAGGAVRTRAWRWIASVPPFVPPPGVAQAASRLASRAVETSAVGKVDLRRAVRAVMCVGCRARRAGNSSNGWAAAGMGRAE